MSIDSVLSAVNTAIDHIGAIESVVVAIVVLSSVVSIVMCMSNFFLIGKLKACTGFRVRRGKLRDKLNSMPIYRYVLVDKHGRECSHLFATIDDAKRERDSQKHAVVEHRYEWVSSDPIVVPTGF